METILELLTTAGRFLVGMWPVMFVVLLFGIFKRRDGFGTMIRLSIKSLVIAWVFFAILRVVFNYFHMDTLQLIEEPENTKCFLIVGLTPTTMERIMSISSWLRIWQCQTYSQP